MFDSPILRSIYIYIPAIYVPIINLFQISKVQIQRYQEIELDFNISISYLKLINDILHMDVRVRTFNRI